ncbi:hypothetical protein [Tabrizicola sp. TH137]|uniref:hypothetical protein n=1 Tax=Tabrizicola sp. TH137 TaxID=2067452 RepID=UPI0011800769|nr:hypothetical protein [Tabrizicola sp. TH137]
MSMPLDRTMNFDPKADFANRIARIQAGGLNTNRTLFVGNEEALALPPGAFLKKRKKSRLGPIFVTLVTCCATGVVALMAGTNLF